MDAQTTLADTAALAALVQSIVRARGRGGSRAPTTAGSRPRCSNENRFLAARDGMEAELIDPELGRRVPARELLEDLAGRLPPPRRGPRLRGRAGRASTASPTAPAPSRQLELAAASARCPASSRLLADDFLAGAVAARVAQRGSPGGITNWLTTRLAASFECRRGGGRSGPGSPRCCGRRGGARPSATISSPRRPAPKTFSFSSIVVKSQPGGIARKVAQAATVSPSAVQTPPWTKPPGCRWRLSTMMRPRAWSSSISSGSIPISAGKLPPRTRGCLRA